MTPCPRSAPKPATFQARRSERRRPGLRLGLRGPDRRRRLRHDLTGRAVRLRLDGRGGRWRRTRATRCSRRACERAFRLGARTRAGGGGQRPVPRGRGLADRTPRGGRSSGTASWRRRRRRTERRGSRTPRACTGCVGRRALRAEGARSGADGNHRAGGGAGGGRSPGRVVPAQGRAVRGGGHARRESSRCARPRRRWRRSETLVSLAAVRPRAGGGRRAVAADFRAAAAAQRTDGWRRVDFAQHPVQLLGAGRFLWVRSGDRCSSYDDGRGRVGRGGGRGHARVPFPGRGRERLRVGADSAAGTVAVGRARGAAGERAEPGRAGGEDGRVHSRDCRRGHEPVEPVHVQLTGAAARRRPSTAWEAEARRLAAAPTRSPAWPRDAHAGGGAPLRRTAARPPPVPFAFEAVSTVGAGLGEGHAAPLRGALREVPHRGPGPATGNTYGAVGGERGPDSAAVRDRRMPADGPLDPQLIFPSSSAGSRPARSPEKSSGRKTPHASDCLVSSPTSCARAPGSRPAPKSRG